MQTEQEFLQELYDKLQTTYTEAQIADVIAMVEKRQTEIEKK